MSNAETHDIWNGEAGRDWAQNQVDLDYFLAEPMRRLLELLPLRPGARVLEIGSGAGSLSLAMARAVGAGGAVLGLDVSDPLLRLARQRAAGMEQLSFRELDIQTEDLAAAGFDICAAQVGMMFFSDPVLAFSRIRSRLATGATIAFNGWAGRDNPWFSLPLQVAERHLGALPTPGGDGPPPPGPLAFADVTYVTGLLDAAGYTGITGTETPVAIRHPDGLEALMRSIAYVGPITTLFRLKPPDAAQKAAIAGEIRAAFATYEQPDRSVTLPGMMTYFTAIAP